MTDENRGYDGPSPVLCGNFVVLTWKTRLCYGVGHILNDLCANIWFTYLLIYMHEVVKFSPVMAGSLLLLGQVADALATPVVGIESDKTGNYKYGRRKIWHLVGVCCVALSFPFIFTKCIGCDEGSEQTKQYAKFIYYVPFVVIFQFGWATTQISHLALIPELSECKIEKVTLNAIRYACTVGSGIVVFVVMWILIRMLKDTDHIGPEDHKEFMLLALITVGIGLLFMVIFHVGVKEKPRLNCFIKNEKSKRNAKNWKLWFKEPQFYKMGVIYMSTRLIVNISQVYIPLFTKISLDQNKEIIATVPLIVFVSGFVTAIAAKPLNVHLGEKLTYVLGLFIILGNCVWCWKLQKENNQVYGFAVLLGVGGSLCLVTCLAMLANLIGENVETGAFVYGAMSFLDKLANGIAVQVIQVFSPKCDGSCIDCERFYRDIMMYFPAAAAIVALLATATLFRQDIGLLKPNAPQKQDKEPLLNTSGSVQVPYGSCNSSKDLQPRRTSWESAQDIY